MSLTEILNEIPRLNAEDRALLADKLAESLDPADGGEIAAAWREETQSRLKEIQSARVREIPGCEGLDQIRKKFGG